MLNGEKKPVVNKIMDIENKLVMGLRKDGVWKESGCGYERATWGNLVVMEIFCILTTSTSVS